MHELVRAGLGDDVKVRCRDRLLVGAHHSMPAVHQRQKDDDGERVVVTEPLVEAPAPGYVVEQVAVVDYALLRKLVEQVDVVLRVLRLLGLQLSACIE